MKYSKTPTSLWAALKEFATGQTFSPDAQAARLGIKMQTPEKTVHEQAAEALIDIQRKNSKGYQIIDINPNILDRDDYFPQIEINTLVELFGPEAVSTLSGYYEDATIAPPYSTAPYWRTIEIPISGNFLKVDYLPVRTNDNVSFTPGGYTIPDKTNKTDNSDSFLDFSPKHAGDQILLLQFQDTQGAPHIAKPGQVYKSEFTTVFLTFKAFGPRIRVTIGSNSTIEEDVDRSANMDLACGPGYGLFNDPYMHGVPFCITDQDLNAIQNPTSFGAYTSTSGATVSADLISNFPQILNRCYKVGGANSDLQIQQYTNLYQYTNDGTSATCAIAGGTWTADNFFRNGMSIGWITGFNASASLYVNTATDYQAFLDIGLEVVRYNASGSTVTVVRRLCMVPLMLGVNVSGSIGQDSKEVQLATPIRYTLRPREAIRIFVKNTVFTGLGAINAQVKFSVQGYSLGALAGIGTKSGFAVCPFDHKIKVTENPYPLDQSYSNNPRF